MKQKGFAPLLIILLIAILGVVGYLGYKRLQPVNQFTNQPTIFHPAITTPLATPDITADWKTYTSDLYGYSIQYPKDWVGKEWQKNELPIDYSAKTSHDQTNDELQGFGFALNKDYSAVCSVGVLSNAKNYTLEQLASMNKIGNYDPDLTKVVGDTTFGDVPAKKFDIFLIDHDDTVIGTVKNGYIYVFEYPNAAGNPNNGGPIPELEKACISILSTFKFTK